MAMDQLFSRETPVISRRGVHFDLKGLPPTPDRFVQLLKLVKAARYNVVLVEWEDSFPWTVDERFRSPTAYSPDDIRRFNGAAAELGIELIPLVQSLGHMETPLSVAGYEPLRELPNVLSSLDPLNPASRQLIQRMVDDVLTLMPGVKHFHLGGDESWTFGTAPHTAEFVQKHGKGALYLQHIGPALDALVARGIRPILWHDMMIDWDSAALTALAARCDLMTWGYMGHPDQSPPGHHCRTEYFQRFKEHGVTLWGGTAYKGTGDTPERHMADRPDPKMREENALAWAAVAQRLDYVGVIATGWSRWSVDTVQCIPIDAALDCLVQIGAILHDGKSPAGGLEACVNAMEEVGEKERFVACRTAMEKLTNVRRRAWQAVQFARQQVALAQIDPRRKSAAGIKDGMKVVPQLGEIVNQSRGIARDVRQALKGLTDPIWIEEYLTTRLRPLEEEFEELSRGVK